MVIMKSRPLSRVEHTIWRISRAAPLNFATVGVVEGPVDAERLRRAAASVQARHPFFRARIDHSNFRRPCFRWPDEVPALDIEIAEPGEGWVDVMERALNHRFDAANEPLVRIAWVPEGPERGRLVVTFHHVIGDGLSGVFVLRDLVAAAAGSHEGALVPLGDTRPIDDRLAPRARGLAGKLRVARFLASETWTQWRHGAPAHPRIDEPAPPQSRTVRVVPHELDAETTTRIAARARAEGTSVHGALLAAIALSVVADHDADRPVPIVLGSPIDLRRRLEPPAGEDAGFFVSMIPFRCRLDHSMPFWDLARAIKGDVTAAQRSGLADYALLALPVAMFLLGGHRRDGDAFAARWEKAVHSTSGLTNLGRLDIETTFGDLRLDAVHFSVNPSALGHYVCTATSLHGRLFWNFMTPEPLFDREHAHALADATVARVLAAVD